MFHRQAYKLKTDAAAVTVSLNDAKAACRLESTFTADDALITGYIATATSLFTQLTGHCPINQTWQLAMDSWPHEESKLLNQWWDGVRDGSVIGGLCDAIDLKYRPLVSVASIKTYSQTNTESVYSTDNYAADTFSNRIAIMNGASPPSDTRSYNAIIVEFVAGFGTESGNVPDGIKEGIKQLVAYWYEHRGDELLSTTSQGKGVLDTESSGWAGLPAGVQVLWSLWRRMEL